MGMAARGGRGRRSSDSSNLPWASSRCQTDSGRFWAGSGNFDGLATRFFVFRRVAGGGSACGRGQTASRRPTRPGGAAQPTRSTPSIRSTRSNSPAQPNRSGRFSGQTGGRGFARAERGRIGFERGRVGCCRVGGRGADRGAGRRFGRFASRAFADAIAAIAGARSGYRPAGRRAGRFSRRGGAGPDVAAWRFAPWDVGRMGCRCARFRGSFVGHAGGFRVAGPPRFGKQAVGDRRRVGR